MLGRLEEALSLRRDVYFGHLKLNGEDNADTLLSALNYASTLSRLERHEEAKSLLRESMPVAQRILGASHDYTLRMMTIYAIALISAGGATLADRREAATTLEEAERIARRVLGGAHPVTTGIEKALGVARAALARETS